MAGAIKKEDIIIKIQNQKRQFVCPRLSAIITTRDMHILMCKNVSQFPRRTRASSISSMGCTRAKKTLIFLLEKMIPSATQSKHAQDMLNMMVNVSHEKVATFTFTKAAKETNVCPNILVVLGPCFCSSKTRTTCSAFLSTNV